MAKTILRALFDVMFYLVTLPLRFLSILIWFLFGLYYMIAYKDVKSYWIETTVHNELLKFVLRNEWHWIKTGKTLDLETEES